MQRKLHNNSDATLKILYGRKFGVYFRNSYRTIKKMGQGLLNLYPGAQASAQQA